MGKDPEQIPREITQNMRNISALHATSRKWRFLVETSKPWAAIRILDHNFGFRTWWFRDYTPIAFHKYMRNLPPFDQFSIDNIEALVLWVESWYDMDTRTGRFVCHFL